MAACSTPPAKQRVTYSIVGLLPNGDTDRSGLRDNLFEMIAMRYANVLSVSYSGE